MSETSPEINKEPWFKTYWRPAMGWLYFAICLYDFIIAPTLYLYVYRAATKFEQWDPLTLKGAGLFHLAMGAIVGITSYSRGKEKSDRLMVSSYSSRGDTVNRSTVSIGGEPDNYKYDSDINRYPSRRYDSYDRRDRFDDEPPLKGGPFR